jgi:alpha-1,2-mannosyltransferase
MTGLLDAASRYGLSPRATRAVEVTLFAVMPLGVLLLLLGYTVRGDADAIDFRSFYTAASSLLDGNSPYPVYVYPPLTAFLSMPLALVPLSVAEGIVIVGLAAAVVVTLRVLEVEDWRCYGLALLWPPVISAIQTGNITILLGLGAALAWRYRERPLACSVSIGATLAAKFFLWPLLVWSAATRRYVTVALTCVAGLAFVFLPWAVIGFSGLSEYGSIVRRVQGVVERDSYTTYVLALDAGASQQVARAIWLALGAGLVAAVVLLGRRGDERSAFIVAVAAALALTPIVWLHYFALLLVVAALAAPRLGLVWFVPLGMVLTPGSGHPTPFETVWTLAIAGLVVALALRRTLRLVSPQLAATRAAEAA